MAVFKKDGCYWADFYFSGSRKRKKVGPSKRQAERVLSKIKSDIVEGKYIDNPESKAVSFYKLCTRYIDEHCKVNKISWDKIDTIHIEKFKKFFGNRHIIEIRQSHVEAFKMMRANKHLAHASINRELACLKHIFTKAIEWELLEVNPVKKVKMYKLTNERCRYLEKDELRRLIEQAAPHLKPIIILAISTGMRKGEILKLKWKEIDIKRGLIYVTKTKNWETRKIPMNESAKQALLSVLLHDDQEYVFCKADGKPYGNIRKGFEQACNRAGIKDFHFHDTRHCFASYLAMAGVDLYTISQLLGHKSLAMTQRYAHLSDRYKKQAVDRICHCIDTYWTPATEKKIAEFVSH